MDTLNKEKEELVRKKEQFKTIMISAISLFIISTVALIFSIISDMKEALTSKEYIYILVMALSFIISIIALIFYKRTQNKLNNQ